MATGSVQKSVNISYSNSQAVVLNGYHALQLDKVVQVIDA
jgi:hypothetical protein